MSIVLISNNNTGENLSAIKYHEEKIKEVSFNNKLQKINPDILTAMIFAINCFLKEIGFKLKMIIYFNTKNKNEINEMNKQFEDPKPLGIIQIINGETVNLLNLSENELITVNKELIEKWDKQATNLFGQRFKLKKIEEDTEKFLSSENKLYEKFQEKNIFNKTDFITYLKNEMMTVDKNKEEVEALNYFLLKNIDCFLSTYNYFYSKEEKKYKKEEIKRKRQPSDVFGAISEKLNKKGECMPKFTSVTILHQTYLKNFIDTIKNYITKELKVPKDKFTELINYLLLIRNVGIEVILSDFELTEEEKIKLFNNETELSKKTGVPIDQIPNNVCVILEKNKKEEIFIL